MKIRQINGLPIDEKIDLIRQFIIVAVNTIVLTTTDATKDDSLDSRRWLANFLGLKITELLPFFFSYEEIMGLITNQLSDTRYFPFVHDAIMFACGHLSAREFFERDYECLK